MVHKILANEPQDAVPPVLPDRPFGPPGAWSRETLRDANFLRSIPEAVLRELEGVAAELRRNPLPMQLLTPSMFRLPVTMEFLAAIRKGLDEGVGFVVLDRLPLGNYSLEEVTALFWVIGSILSRPVAQDWKGAMVQDVVDSGKKLGEGVRGNITNAELTFHTDNSYALAPPEHVALLCIRPAQEGGLSRLVSWETVYNQLLTGHPTLLPRAFRPFLFDRNFEHPPGAPTIMSKPLFRLQGGLRVCYFSHGIRRAYSMAGKSLDRDGAALLDAIDAIEQRPELQASFRFLPGQIQIVNNRRVGHSRTAYQDPPDGTCKRHLVRLWLREQGRVAYNG